MNLLPGSVAQGRGTGKAFARRSPNDVDGLRGPCYGSPMDAGAGTYTFGRVR